jgi:hypothetical protein
MTKVFVNVALSLDGCMAPEGMAIEHRDTPEYNLRGPIDPLQRPAS